MPVVVLVLCWRIPWAGHALALNVLIHACSCPLTSALLLLDVVNHVCSDPVLLRDNADCSCCCFSLGIAHPICSPSLLVCATSVGCYSSKFARVLGCHANAVDSGAAVSSCMASCVDAFNLQG